MTASGSCPAPKDAPRHGSGPIGYFRTVRVADGVSVRFAGLQEDATLQVIRTGKCEATASATFAEGASHTVLGVRLTVDRILRSSGGAAPEVDVTYRLG